MRSENKGDDQLSGSRSFFNVLFCKLHEISNFPFQKIHGQKRLLFTIVLTCYGSHLKLARAKCGDIYVKSYVGLVRQF